MLIWFPGHHGVSGNVKADECVVRGSSLDKDLVCSEVLIPLVIAPREIDDWALSEIAAKMGCN